jgi:hypothetical protein
MDWIKKNPEKFSLLLLSVALLGAAAFLVFTGMKFLASFDPLKVPPVESTKLPPLYTKSLEDAQASLEKPQTWAYDPEHLGSLFISKPYVVLDNNTPFGDFKEPQGAMFYRPVPNDWITKYHLDLMDANVINEDPDSDGFSNKEEFLAGTDPTDKNSHPPYTDKLCLEKFISVPFRLIFNGRPDEHTFQIDTVDIQQPTQILQMGETIDKTKYKIVKFEEKHKPDPDSGGDKDISELTVENSDTGKKVVLVLGQTVNDPDSYARFRYFWKGSKPFPVKKDASFTIDPETDVTYKLIDINENGATIVNLKTNQEIKIPLVKTGETFHSSDGNYYDPVTGKEITK